MFWIALPFVIEGGLLWLLQSWFAEDEASPGPVCVLVTLPVVLVLAPAAVAFIAVKAGHLVGFEGLLAAELTSAAVLTASFAPRQLKRAIPIVLIFCGAHAGLAYLLGSESAIRLTPLQSRVCSLAEGTLAHGSRESKARDLKRRDWDPNRRGVRLRP
jgi:hypothetical protein